MKMQKILNHSALKEWAGVISALASGQQIVLVRKGGIADARFGVEANSFYLVPTWLHQKEHQFKPEMKHHFLETDRVDVDPELIPVEYYAEVAAVHRLEDLEQLQRLEPLVVFTGATIEERYRFRPEQAVHVIALRVYRLPSVSLVKNSEAYRGCRSWLSLDDEISIAGALPVLTAEVFAKKLADLEGLLA